MIILIVILILFFTVVSAFLSASETSLIGISKIRLRNLANSGKKNAVIAQDLISKRLDKVIVTILVGNNFVNIAISSIATAISVFFYGPKIGVIVATFCSSFFIMVFCEIAPKIFAVRFTEKTALFVAPIMKALLGVFGPIANFFTKLGNLIVRILGGSPAKRSPLVTEEELRLMIEVGKEEGVLTDEERKMLHRIFEFGDTLVSQAMKKKEDIVAIDVNASQEDFLNKCLEEGHSRIPVYEGSIDNIIGIIDAHAMLYVLKNKQLFVIRDLIEGAYYVEPAKRVNELLREFQQKKIQIAIVVDKNKKTQGLVTLEDLIEEIVGEIEEE
ncbi:MAG: hemolysin family protein [Candidatus Omnitrophica bacterium]|nr:hemolysin family protein [Candidatus Omnitrophota bacterium]HOX53860.1 hemolysin family protein [Candidatus Omnitrophota bacterium]